MEGNIMAVGIKRVVFETDVTFSIPVKFSLDLPEIMTEKESKEFVKNHYKEIMNPDEFHNKFQLPENATIQDDGESYINIV